MHILCPASWSFVCESNIAEIWLLLTDGLQVQMDCIADLESVSIAHLSGGEFSMCLRAVDIACSSAVVEEVRGNLCLTIVCDSGMYTADEEPVVIVDPSVYMSLLCSANLLMCSKVYCLNTVLGRFAFFCLIPGMVVLVSGLTNSHGGVASFRGTRKCFGTLARRLCMALPILEFGRSVLIFARW